MDLLVIGSPKGCGGGGGCGSCDGTRKLFLNEVASSLLDEGFILSGDICGGVVRDSIIVKESTLDLLKIASLAWLFACTIGATSRGVSFGVCD